MQTIANNGYTEAQVLAALRGAYGSRRFEFRYEILDEDNRLLDNAKNVLAGSIDYAALSDIKRTAKMTVRDDGTIDFLSNRIKPYARLRMPAQAFATEGAVRVSSTYAEAVARISRLAARWKFDEPSGTTAAEEVAGADLTLDAQAVPAANALVEDGGLALGLPAGGSAHLDDADMFLNGAASLTYVSWFRSDTVGQAAKLFDTTLPVTWGDFAGYTYDEFDASGPWNESINGANGIRIEFLPSTKNIRVSIYIDNSVIQATTPVNTQTTERTMFGFTWASGGSLILYLNGQKVTEVAGSLIGTIQNVTDLTVGGAGFEGVVDDTLFALAPTPEDVMYDLYVTGAAVGPGGNPERQYVEWPLGVFLLSSPERTADENGAVTRDVDAYDQMVVLQGQLTPEPYYVAAGAVYTEAIDELLGNTPGIPSYAIVPTTKTLPALRMWEAGTSHMRIVQDLIGAINYEALYFDENGTAIVTPYVAPQTRVIEYRYEADAVSVLYPGATQTLDLYNQPNQWSIVVSEPDRPLLSATYTNDDPGNPTSTVNRGRVITDVRTENDAADLGTLQDKVERLAQDATQIYETVEFSTGLMPIHSHRDVYYLSYPDLAIGDKYGETKWSIKMEAGAPMTHSARRTVSLNGSLT